MGTITSAQIVGSISRAVMIAKVALFCLLASVQGAPEPQFYHLNHPKCSIAHEDFELQNCVPATENVCSTKDVTSEVIDYETRCKSVVSQHCPGGVLVPPTKVAAPGVVAVEKNVDDRKKREADPHTVLAGVPYVHHVAPAVAPATVTLKHACSDVTTEHCAEVPIIKPVVTPVETCHVVTKVSCEPVVQKIPKTECVEPEEQTVYAHAPWAYGYHHYGK